MALVSRLFDTIFGVWVDGVPAPTSEAYNEPYLGRVTSDGTDTSTTSDLSYSYEVVNSRCTVTMAL